MIENLVKKIKALEMPDVLQVYSGKPGCACGCKGKYAVNPAYKALVDAERSYVQDNANIRQVRRVLEIFQENAERVRALDDEIFVLDLHEARTYTLYLVDRTEML